MHYLCRLCYLEGRIAGFCRQHTSDIEADVFQLVLGFAGVPIMAHLNLWSTSIAMPKPNIYREQSN